MNNWTFRHVLVVILLLITFGARSADAASHPVSGSYEVIGKTQLGSQTKVQLRIHLTNHEQDLLYVQRILLWDFAHPPVAGPTRLSIALGSGSTEETTQEFVVSRTQFDQWQRGLRPRVVLDLQTVTGFRITQAIRLDRVSARVAGRKGE